MEDYEINSSTLCIVPYKDHKSMVYEYDNKFIINMSVQKIIERSCLFFGSTFEGRREASCKLINTMHKVPIIVEESNDILFFPTLSHNNDDCIWISFNNLESLDKIDAKYSKVKFKNNHEFKFKVSYFIISNQIIRCNRLKFEFNRRKKAV